MGAALHVLATLVVVPYVILAIGFLLLGHAIASGSLLSFFDRLLNHFLWIVPWGLIGFACAMMLVAIIGVIPGFRRIGALCLFALAGASLAIILNVGSRFFAIAFPAALRLRSRLRCVAYFRNE